MESLLLGPKKFNEDLRLSARELVERVPTCGQVDEAQVLQGIWLRSDRPRSDLPEVSFELSNPRGGRQRRRL